MSENVTVGQDPDLIDGPSGGIGRRIGQRVLGAVEGAQMDAAASRAARVAEARPAHHRARRLMNDADSRRKDALEELGAAAAALVRGDGDEVEVRRVEQELAAAERDLTRYAAAARTLADEAGLIYDSERNLLNR